jgi:hypothetical protein
MRRTPLQRSPMKRGRKRSKAERERVYGTEARQTWYRAQPCLTCHRSPVELAHVVTGGMGRKSDASNLLPLCMTCHHELHSVGIRTFEWTWSEVLHGLTLRICAAKYDRLWRAVSGGGAAA